MEMSDTQKISLFLQSGEYGGEAPSLKEGTVVGDWRVVAFLSKGCNGEVYRVCNQYVDFYCALKICHCKASDAQRLRFKREASVLAGLDGVAFPRFLGCGEYKGRLFIVMEYLYPLDLPNGEMRVAKFAYKLCGALSFMHRKGLVHRDVKPANIMRRQDGELVLIDYGLVLPRHEEKESLADRVSFVDSGLEVVGTPGYSAPEQFTGGVVDFSCDVHAVGVLIHRCFNGRPSFYWRRIIERATSSISARRFSTIGQLALAIRFRHWQSVSLLLISAGVLGCVLWRALSMGEENGNLSVPLDDDRKVNGDSPPGYSAGDSVGEWL